MNQHGKALVKLLRECAYRHDLYRVFGDFVELAALSLVNRVDPRQAEEREARYMETIGRYEKAEQARFPQMFAALVDAMEFEPGDVLGEVFGELELGNAARGQFFTPFHLCRFMASLTVDAEFARGAITERGFFTVQEPACGAGAMILALALHLQESDINYQQHLHVTAIDVDPRAVHMAYVQFSLMYIPAVVVLGNTLALESREVWVTPAHVMGLWDQKLRRGYALGSAMDTSWDPPVPAPELRQPVVLARDAQLELFA